MTNLARQISQNESSIQENKNQMETYEETQEGTSALQLLKKVFQTLTSRFAPKSDLDFETWERLEQKPRFRSDCYMRGGF